MMAYPTGPRHNPPEPTRAPDGAPGMIYPPGTLTFAEPAAPGAPMSMKISSDEEAHPPGGQGRGYRPGSMNLMMADMKIESDEKRMENMTIDQAIIDAYGGVNGKFEIKIFHFVLALKCFKICTNIIAD